MEKSVTVKTEKLKEPVMCLKDYIRKVNNINRKCGLFMYEVILLKDNARITFQLVMNVIWLWFFC